jgi:hypothetical protein
MQKIEDLNEQEILALTDEQIEKFVKLRMAEEGIKIIQVPVEPKYTKLPAPAVPAHSINGVSYPVTDKGAADRISAAIKKEAAYFTYTDYDYRASDIKYLNGGSFEGIGSIDTRMYYTKSQGAELKEVARKNKELEDAYNAELREYTDNREQATEIRKEIEGIVENVRSKYRMFDRLLASFKEYLTLADGNSEIAWKFLHKAYSVSPEAAQYIEENTREVDAEK